MRQFGVAQEIYNPLHDRLRKTQLHQFNLPLFFNISKQFLAPRGLSAECVQGLQGAGSSNPYNI